jgi:hypothetical protein
VDEVFAGSADKIAAYAAEGDNRIRNSLCGEILQRSGGRANPSMVDQLVRSKLPIPPPKKEKPIRQPIVPSTNIDTSSSKREKIRGKKPTPSASSSNDTGTNDKTA